MFEFKKFAGRFSKVKAQLRAKGISNQTDIVNYLLALPVNTVKWYTLQYQSVKSELATSGDPSPIETYVGHQVHHMGYIRKLL